MMLLKLLSRIDHARFLPEVVSLTELGDFSQNFVELGIPVTSLGMKRGVPAPQSLLRLRQHLSCHRPHLVQTWMYHADLLGGVSAFLAGRLPVIWNIRHSGLDSKIDKKTTLLAARLCARTSHYLPAKIVCCAHKACQLHAQLGYDADKMCVIPNGFDVEKFSPSPLVRRDVRDELGISQYAIVIGCVARYHPMKDHRNLIAAAAIARNYGYDVQYVLCGDGMEWGNRELAEMIRGAGLEKAFHLLGCRSDVARLTASFDISALPSACGEAFSNTIGEAMASAVPCAVTDVGDAAFIVGDTGVVVPPRQPDAMAVAWDTLIRMGNDCRRDLGSRARSRILNNFSLDRIVDQYQDLYLNTIGTTLSH